MLEPEGFNSEDHRTRLRTYRCNIDRYHRLLKTELSELERQFIERRLSDEKSAMESLANVMAARTPSWTNASRALREDCP